MLKALREGRREAYVSVIEAHYRSVYRFLLFLGRDASLAEDLTQRYSRRPGGRWAVFAGMRRSGPGRTEQRTEY